MDAETINVETLDWYGKKTPEIYFYDWFSEAFGYTYGTGEPYIVRALWAFLSACNTGPRGNSYSYTAVEEVCGQTVAWLLICKLCEEGIIEYGTSPRYAWLTDEGVALKQFSERTNAETAVDVLCGAPNDYFPCARDFHNCADPSSCANPFWSRQAREGTKYGTTTAVR